jgi:phosphoribosylformylglycinamidine (FGAM) synthase-like amidotransferase family enzyme
MLYTMHAAHTLKLYPPVSFLPHCRFESRWINVQIADDSPSMWLAGMGGSTIGVWAAHGEGQVLFPDAAVQAAVLDKKLAPIR